jgi:hypothetical protein
MTPPICERSLLPNDLKNADVSNSGRSVSHFVPVFGFL